MSSDSIDASSPAAEQRYLALSAAWKSESPTSVLPLLVAHLEDEDSANRALAARLLQRASEAIAVGSCAQLPAVVSGLKSRLTDSDPDVRFEVVRALLAWTTPSEELFLVLLELFDDATAHFSLRSKLANALSLFRHAGADIQIVPRLIGLLSGDRPELREAGARGLAARNTLPIEAVSALVPLLSDEDPFCREAGALAAMYAPSTPELVAALDEASRDEDSVVAEAAIKAMSAIVR